MSLQPQSWNSSFFNPLWDDLLQGADMWKEPQLSRGLSINQNGSLLFYTDKFPCERKWEKQEQGWDFDPSALLGNAAKD